MLTSFLILATCILAILLRFYAVEPSPQKADFHRHKFRFRSRLFLIAWVTSFRVLFARLVQQRPEFSQIHLLQIRQALNTMWYGRGLIHS